MNTSATDQAHTIPPEHLAEAGVWIARLHGESRGPALEEGLRAWLQASPINARAFEVATEVWQDAGNIRHVVSFAPRPRRALSFSPAAVVTAIATAAVLVGAALWFLPERGVGTRVGEQRTLNLEDGTHIFLNTATRVVVSYDRTARRVELKEGEALFDVTNRPDRPFVVTVGNRQVKALGTTFVVRRDPSALAVTLLAGKVAVTPSPGAPSLVLAPGERVAFDARHAPRIDRPQLERALAWRRGQVILDDTPLADAVAEMNRYSALRLVVERPETAALLVNGLFQAGDSKSFAEAIALTYGLEVVNQGDALLLAGAPTRAGLDVHPDTP
jgi:transmembrane sensor